MEKPLLNPQNALSLIIANIELVKGITFPETQEIFEGRIPANADVEKVIVVNNLKRARIFLFDNLDYPLDIQLATEYNRIIGEGGLYQTLGKLRDQIVRIFQAQIMCHLCHLMKA